MREELGGRIRAVRERRGLTQDEAAQELGILTRSLQDYELGNAAPRLGPRRRRVLAWLTQHEEAAA